MDTQMLQANRSDKEIAPPIVAPAKTVTRDQLVKRLIEAAGSAYIHAGLRALTDYVGASHYLLARCDLVQESGLDFVVSSDWPFGLVRRLASDLVGNYVRTSELEKCLLLFQPSFALLAEDVIPPEGSSRQY